jgi:hypothetical protein
MSDAPERCGKTRKVISSPFGASHSREGQTSETDASFVLDSETCQGTCTEDVVGGKSKNIKTLERSYQIYYPFRIH